MYKTLSVCLLAILAGCSTNPNHVGELEVTKSGDEFSIIDRADGFTVAGHYSEYQFIRSSQDAFVGCTKLINNAAKLHAENHQKTVSLPKWEDVTIVDHGRDLITAIMNVNCTHDYKYYSEQVASSELPDLNSLVDLYERGLLTKDEFTSAKSKLLSNENI
ncbi:SHOCT domain-containing protein [Shewanella sp. 0m-11]